MWGSSCVRSSGAAQVLRRYLLPSPVSAARRSYTSQGAPSSLTIGDKAYPTDSWTNVPPSILKHYGRSLHLQPNHPLSITRQLIESRFPGFQNHNSLSPVVTVHQNFDSLGFTPDHPGRNKTDTYYVNKDTVLRTHTTAHEVDVFRANSSDGYTISADVYRRDAVDRSHYPVFHQMEGALTWDRNAAGYSLSDIADAVKAQTLKNQERYDLTVEDPNPTWHEERNPRQAQYHSEEEVEYVAAHLKRSLEDMVITIFTEADKALAAAGLGVAQEEPLKVRWVEAFFPHTSPSWELEVWWKGDWLEVLGCGVIEQRLLNSAGVDSRIGWAFGIGLERIAMLLFGIPDIRLFWSQDRRFLDQFDETQPIRRFQPFSKHPAAPRDVAFWLPKAAQGSIIADTAAASSTKPSPAGGQHTEPVISGPPAFHENDLMEIVRNTAGDSVEDVALIDDFTHPKTGRRSLCYRITYRSLEKTLTNEEANSMHEHIRGELVSRFGVELR